MSMIFYYSQVWLEVYKRIGVKGKWNAVFNDVFINWFERVFKRKKKYVNYIRGNETLPEPLSKDEEFRILTNFQAGDERARQTLIEHNLRLVVYIAKKFESSGVNLEDLISIGTLDSLKVCKRLRWIKILN